jgi:hypothetical protein
VFNFHFIKVSTENDNNFGYEKITIVVDNIPLINNITDILLTLINNIADILLTLINSIIDILLTLINNIIDILLTDQKTIVILD